MAGEVMPFGKHRGTPMHLVPEHYLRWMIRERVRPDLARKELGNRGVAVSTATARAAKAAPAEDQPARRDGYSPGAASGVLNRKVRIEGHHFVIEAPPNPVLTAAIRSLPGRWFHGKDCSCGKCAAPRQYWTVPVSSQTMEMIIEFADEWKFAVESSAVERARQAIDQRKNLLDASVALDAEIPPLRSASGHSPRGYQRAGIHYLQMTERCLLADEMGLGKTPQALLTILIERAFPAVIVCPSSLKLKWLEEVREWCPRILCQVAEGGNFQPRSDVPITIVNYDLLRVEGERRETKLVGLAQRLHELAPAAVVLDESHYAKNSRALRTRACHLLAKGAKYIFLLTGTPVLNRPEELISQLRIMRRLEDLGGYQAFVSRYCGARMKRVAGKQVLDASGASNLAELNKELRARCFIRRRKSDVMKDLPAMQRSVIGFQLGNRAEYERAKRDLVEWLRSEGKNQEASRVAFNETLAKINYLRRLAVRGKFESACQWIEEFLESGEKLLIFAYHRDVVEGLASRFKAAKIYGDTPIQERQRLVTKFQEDPKMQTLVLNIQSGGVGLNLTAASNVVFMEWAWTPGENDQAEARVYGRANDPHGANAWYLQARETIEDDHLALLDFKRKVADAAQDGGRPVTEQEMVQAMLGKLLRS